MKKYITFVLMSLLFSSHAFSQASVAAEDKIEDIVVKTASGKQKIYSVFRDQNGKNQWYYLPNELRLAEEMVGGVKKAKFMLLRYAYQDIITKANSEGGILIASFTYGIEPEVANALRAEITKRKKMPNPLLSAIPLKSANIDFLVNFEEFTGNVSATPLAGATSASQEMVITIKLNSLGAGVMSGLINGNGLPIRANITYQGVTAPCGFEVKGNWSDVYKFYEKNTKIEGKWGVDLKFVSFGGGADKSVNKLVESMKSAKAMNVEQFVCQDTASNRNMDAKLLDVLTKIETEVYKPENISEAAQLAAMQSILANTEDPSAAAKLTEAIAKKKVSLQFGYQNSVKDVSKRKSGNYIYKNNKKELETRNTTFGSTVSLRSFIKGSINAEKLKKEGYLVDIDANVFPTAIIGLPTINPDFDLRTVVIDVSFQNSDGTSKSESRSWDAATGWKTFAGQDAGMIRFNLIGEKNLKNLSNLKFHLKLQVISKYAGGSFVIEKDHVAELGEKYIDFLETLTEQVVIDGSILDFKLLTQNPEDLATARVSLKQGTFNLNKDIRPMVVNGVAGAPNPLMILMPKTGENLVSKVQYIKATGKILAKDNTIQYGDNMLINEWNNQ